MTKKQFDVLRKWLDSHLKAKLTGDLKGALDFELNAIFDIIRNDRNDAGHPAGKIPERARVYANLVVVPAYLKKLYDLIDWLKTNPL